MSHRLWPDPEVPWDGPRPYAELARFGLGPNSTLQQVLDASFDMSADDLSDEKLNSSWETLRSTRARLLVDFFCVDLPPPAEEDGTAFVGPRPVPLKLMDDLAATLPEVPGSLLALGTMPRFSPSLASVNPWWDDADES